MIAEITPPQSGTYAARLVTYLRLAMYITGMLIGTSLVAFGAGWLGEQLGAAGTLANVHATRHSLLIAIIAAMSIGYGLHEGLIIRLPVPQIPWQVPATWSRFGKSLQFLLYGLVLGSEFFTFMPYASFYIVLLLYVCLGTKSSLILGVAYGMARLVPTLLGVRYALQMGDPQPLAIRIINLKNPFHAFNGIALLALGEILVVIR